MSVSTLNFTDKKVLYIQEPRRTYRILAQRQKWSPRPLSRNTIIREVNCDLWQALKMHSEDQKAGLLMTVINVCVCVFRVNKKGRVPVTT